MRDLGNWFGRVAPAPSAIVANSPYCDLHRAAGALVSVEKTIAGFAGAQSINLFQLTGSVELRAIYGVFTDVTNVATLTGASFDLRDNAATVQLTSAAGTALSGAGLGSLFAKEAGAATAVAFNNSTAARYSESAFNRAFVGGLLTQKAGQNTFIRLTVTTDAATNCEIAVYAAWVCRCPGSSLVTV